MKLSALGVPAGRPAERGDERGDVRRRGDDDHPLAGVEPLRRELLQRCEQALVVLVEND